MTDNTGPQGGQPGGDPAGQGGEWYAGIQDEGLRGYVQTKGFKDIGSLAESYRNFEKLQGVPQDRILRLPDKPDAPEWDSIYQRLGRPDKADGYGLKFEGDDSFAKAAAEVMHKAGVSKSQAQALNEFWNGHVEGLIKADNEARTQRDAAEIAELKTKWGGDYDKNVEIGRRAGREFGLSEQEFQAISGSLGSGKTLELFSRIGSKLGEAAPFDPQGSGGGSGFGMTQEAARARIQALTGDREWAQRYLSGGANEKAEMERLQKIAAGAA